MTNRGFSLIFVSLFVYYNINGYTYIWETRYLSSKQIEEGSFINSQGKGNLERLIF